jgi:transcription factor IIIB subunit 2
LQTEIEAALERDLNRAKKRKMGVPGVEEYDESLETDKFIEESIDDAIQECLVDSNEAKAAEANKKENKYAMMSVIKPIVGIKPDLEALCALSEEKVESASGNPVASTSKESVSDDLDLSGLDDDEINGYILSESEAMFKDKMWNKLNAEYLLEAKKREERLAKEKEEGKPEKKKRRAIRKKNIGPSNTPGEAIEKMLQEKKISNKINYDILKTLTTSTVEAAEAEKEETEEPAVIVETSEILKVGTSKRGNKPNVNLSNNRRFKVPAPIGLPVEENTDANPTIVVENGKNALSLKTFFLSKFHFIFLDDIDDLENDLDVEPEPEPNPEHSSIANLLNQGQEDDLFGFQEDYDY